MPPNNVRINVDVDTTGTPELQQLAAAMRVTQEQVVRLEAQLQSLSHGYQKLGQSITSALDTLGKSGALSGLTTEAAEAAQALKTAGNEITGIVTNLNGQRVKLNVDDSQLTGTRSRFLQFARDLDAAKERAARISSPQIRQVERQINDYRNLLKPDTSPETRASTEAIIAENERALEALRAKHSVITGPLRKLDSNALESSNDTLREDLAFKSGGNQAVLGLRTQELELIRAKLLLEAKSTEEEEQINRIINQRLTAEQNHVALSDELKLRQQIAEVVEKTQRRATALESSNLTLEDKAALDTGGEQAVLALRKQRLETTRQEQLALTKNAEEQARINAAIDKEIRAEENHSGLVQALKLRAENAAAEEKIAALVDRTNSKYLQGAQKLAAERDQYLTQYGKTPAQRDTINNAFDQRAAAERQTDLAQRIAPIDRGSATLESASTRISEQIALQEGGEQRLLEIRKQSLETTRLQLLQTAKTKEEIDAINASINHRVQVEETASGLRQQLTLREEIAATETKFGALVEKTNQRELTGVQKIEAEREKNLKHIAELEARAPDYKGGAKLREQINAKADADLKEEGRFNFRGRRGLGGNVLQSALYAAQSPQYAAFSAVSGLAESLPAAGIAAGVAAIGVGVLAKSLYDVVKSAADAGLETQKFAERTGLSIKEAYDLSAASEIAGVNVLSLATAMRTLEPALTDSSTEGKKARAALFSIKAEIVDMNGQIKPTGAILQEIATKLAAIPEFAHRQTAAQDILGRSARELTPELLHLADNIRKVQGLDLINEKQTDQLAKTAEKINELGVLWKRLQQDFAAHVVGQIDLIAPDLLNSGEKEFQKELEKRRRARGGSGTGSETTDNLRPSFAGQGNRFGVTAHSEQDAKQLDASTIAAAEQHVQEFQKAAKAVEDLQEQRNHLNALLGTGLTSEQRKNIAQGRDALDEQLKTRRTEYENAKHDAADSQAILKDITEKLTPKATVATTGLAVADQIEKSRSLPLLKGVLKEADNTKEGLQKAVTEAESKVTSLTTKVEEHVGAGGINTEPAKQEATELRAARVTLKQAQDRLKAFEGGPRQLGEFERRIFEQEQQAFRLQYPASRFGALPEVIGKEQVFERDVRTADKISAADKQTLINRQRQRVYQPELQTAAERLAGQIAEKNFRLDEIKDRGNLDVLQRRFDLEERLAKLASSPEDAVRSAELITQAHEHQLEISQKLYAADLKRAEQLKKEDPAQYATAVAEATRNQKERIGKADVDQISAAAELRKRTDELAKKDAEELAHIRNETELHGYQLQIEHAAHIAELTRDRESPVTALERAFETEKKLAQLAFDFETRENAVTFRDDPEKRKIEDEKARQRLIEDGQRSEYEREEKLAALRKQERDSSKAAAASLYDAIRGGSRGLHDFFKAQADKIGQNAFAALVGPAFGSVSKGLDPTGQGLIHDLVSGTIFGGSTGAPRLRPDEIGPVAAVPPGQELPHHGFFKRLGDALTGIPERPTAPLITPSADIQAGVLAHPELLAAQQSQAISDEALQASIKQLAEPGAAKLAGPTSEISALIPHLDPMRTSLDTLRGAVDENTSALRGTPATTDSAGIGTTPTGQQATPALTELQAHSLVHSSRNAVTAANTLANAPNPPVTASVDTDALKEALKQPKPPIVVQHPRNWEWTDAIRSEAIQHARVAATQARQIDQEYRQLPLPTHTADLTLPNVNASVQQANASPYGFNTLGELASSDVTGLRGLFAGPPSGTAIPRESFPVKPPSLGLHITGPLPAPLPPEPNALQRLATAANPLPGIQGTIQEWLNRPAEIRKQFDALGAFQEQDKSGKPFTAAQKARIEAAMNAQLPNAEGNFLAEQLAPVVKAGEQIGKGDLAGASGTVIGSAAPFLIGKGLGFAGASLPEVTAGLKTLQEHPAFQALLDEEGGIGPRAERALKSYNPFTQAKRDIAEQTERELSTALGIPRTTDNAPFDLQNETHGIEVKALIDNKRGAITMRKDALARKQAEIDRTGITPYTVAVDKRGPQTEYYLREGLGSFRIGAMDKVPSLAALRRHLFDETGSFGPGSGRTVLSPRVEQVRKQAQLIEESLPPPADTFTRLWRGNRPGEVGVNPSFTSDLPGIALPFQKAYGGALSHVDVPTSRLPEFERKFGAAPGVEFTLPPELAKNAQPISLSIGRTDPVIAGSVGPGSGRRYNVPIPSQDAIAEARRHLQDLPALSHDELSKLDLDFGGHEQVRPALPIVPEHIGSELSKQRVKAVMALGLGYRKALEQAPIVPIGIDELEATQASVSRTLVGEKIAQLASGIEQPPVSVVQYAGQKYLGDGHHTATAAKLAGIDTLNAHLLNLDSPTHDLAQQTAIGRTDPVIAALATNTDATKSLTDAILNVTPGGGVGPNPLAQNPLPAAAIAPTWPGAATRAGADITGNIAGDITGGSFPELPGPSAPYAPTIVLPPTAGQVGQVSQADQLSPSGFPTLGDVASTAPATGTPTSAVAPTAATPATGAHAATTKTSPIAATQSALHELSRFSSAVHGPAGQAFGAAGSISGILQNIQDLRGALAARKARKYEQAYYGLPVPGHAEDLTLPNLDLPPQQAGLSPSGFATLPQQFASIGDTSNLGGILSGGNSYSDQSYRPATAGLAGQFEALPGAPAYQDSNAVTNQGPVSVSPEGVPTFTAQGSTSLLDAVIPGVNPLPSAPPFQPELSSVPVSLDQQITTAYPSINAGSTGVLPQSVLDAANPFNSPLTALKTINTGLEALSAGFGAGGLGSGSGSSGSSLLSTPISRLFGLGDVPKDKKGSTQQIGDIATTGATVTAGALAAISGFKRGGARGDLQGVGSILGTAAVLDPEPISKAVLGIAAGITAMVSAFLPDPRAQRERQLTQELFKQKIAAEPFVQPGINVEESATGRAISTDYLGDPRALNARPLVYTIREGIGFQPLHGDRVVTAPVRQVGIGPLGGFANPLAAQSPLVSTNPPNLPLGSRDINPLVMSGNGPANTFRSGTQQDSARQDGPQQQAPAFNLTYNNTFNQHALDAQDIMRRAPDIATAVESQLQSTHRIVRTLRDTITQT